MIVPRKGKGPRGPAPWPRFPYITDQAITLAGVEAIAERIGLSTSSIRMWRHNGRIPAQYLEVVAEMSGIPAKQLRPDLAPVL